MDRLTTGSKSYATLDLEIVRLRPGHNGLPKPARLTATSGPGLLQINGIAVFWSDGATLRGFGLGKLGQRKPVFAGFCLKIASGLRFAALIKSSSKIEIQRKTALEADYCCLLKNFALNICTAARAVFGSLKPGVQRFRSPSIILLMIP